MSDSTLSSTNTKAETTEPELTGNSPDRSTRKKKTFLFLAIILAVVWWGILIWLATSQANQPILNRIQLGQSTDVITAKVLDVSSGKIEVIETFRGDLKAGETISLMNLSKTNAKKEASFVIPLYEYKQGQWDVTPFRSPKDGETVFIIYPNTDSLTADLQSLLESLKQQ